MTTQDRLNDLERIRTLEQAIRYRDQLIVELRRGEPQKAAQDLYEAATNFRNRHWRRSLVAGDDDWLRDALEAYRRHMGGAGSGV